MYAIRSYYDNKRVIRRAATYTIEWADLPSVDLYMNLNLDIPLQEGLRTGDLGLKNLADGEPLSESFAIRVSET